MFHSFFSFFQLIWIYMYIVAGCSPTTSNFIVLCFYTRFHLSGLYKWYTCFLLAKKLPYLYLILSFSQLLKNLQNLRSTNKNPCKIKRQTI